MPITMTELTDQITFTAQLNTETGPVVLINTFTVAPPEAGQLRAAWATDAAYMKGQPGFIATQLHQGVGTEATFVNVAVWESAAALRAAFFSPTFQANLAHYPASTVTTPHLCRKVAVPGICVA